MCFSLKNTPNRMFSADFKRKNFDFLFLFCVFYKWILFFKFCTEYYLHIGKNSRSDTKGAIRRKHAQFFN